MDTPPLSTKVRESLANETTPQVASNALAPRCITFDKQTYNRVVPNLPCEYIGPDDVRWSLVGNADRMIDSFSKYVNLYSMINTPGKRRQLIATASEFVAAEHIPHGSSVTLGLMHEMQLGNFKMGWVDSHERRSTFAPFRGPSCATRPKATSD